ncbi:MAG: phycobilisome rod-core linker polypeptide [Cyanobacteria bacterium J06621_11]
MALTTLSYPPSSQNQRVANYTVGSDEQPYIYDADISFSESEKSDLIQAAYRQIFHEQHTLESYRQPFLESQFRANQITTRDLIQGLATSDAFKRLNYESNNNYRFVEICIQRILGREVFNEKEKVAWSIVVATQGMVAFIDALLSSEEYQNTFNDSIVPYQRSRILPKQVTGRLPFARTARYDQRDRPDLVPPNSSIGIFDISDLGDVGGGLFAAVLGLIIIFSLLLVIGSAASL